MNVTCVGTVSLDEVPRKDCDERLCDAPVDEDHRFASAHVSVESTT